MKTGIPDYNVSELTFLIKNALEDHFPVVRVRGEISGFRSAASGHCYFNLKDEDSVIAAVLFRQQRDRLGFTPKDGMKIAALGRVTVYPPRGNYQLVCETLEEGGRGDILYRLEQLKQKLREEGLFDPERKRPLPPYPSVIGIATSAGGAALQDVIRVLRRRMPAFRLLVKDTLVQGRGSAASIIESLDCLYARRDVDVILLTRGGGSMEDLLSFSDEEVVRKAAASPVPLICAVGHEVDVSLAELACDLRAATPSAAAEILSSPAFQLKERLRTLKSVLSREMAHSLEKQRWRFEGCNRESLKDLIQEQLNARAQFLDNWGQEILLTLENRLIQWRQRCALARETLNRGFPFIQAAGRLVRAAAELKKGERISVYFQDGVKQAEILADEQQEDAP